MISTAMLHKTIKIVVSSLVKVEKNIRECFGYVRLNVNGAI
jgi:hypothetical protein